MHRQPRRLVRSRYWTSRFRMALAVSAMTIGTLGQAIAAPSAEYAPEAEAGFRIRCEARGMAPHQCQAIMEALQARIGYAAFLDSIAADPSPAERIVAIGTGATPGRSEMQP
jgi:hypothetical protein